MEFQYIQFQLLLFILIPLLIIFYIISELKRKGDLNKIGKFVDISKIISTSFVSRIIKFAILVFIVIFAIFTMMRPKWGSRAVSITKTGFEIVFLLDVSPSMLAVDIRPNRLSQAKIVISDIVDELEGNKFALVLFSGEAIVEPPLTSDINAFKRYYLEIASVDQIPVRGTVFNKAFEKAENLFSNRIDVGKTIILFSDGEKHDDGSIKIAERLYRDKGILTNTIGIGTEQGSYIPEGTSGGKKVNREGNVINTRLEKENLIHMANSGGGAFVLWDGNDSSINPIYEKINQLKKGKLGTRSMEIMKDQFQYFLIVSIILFIIYFFIPERKFGKFNRIK